ncbi:MAG: hypothetical protein ACOYL5_13220 [Phototrophicaceae bacterium]
MAYIHAPLDKDEVWAVWQTYGTPAQIIQWTSPSEFPLYFLLVGGWRILTSDHPYLMRVLPLLGFMVAGAIFYRAVKRLYGWRAALMALIFFLALPFQVFISLYARSYILAVIGVPLSLWMAARYFGRPSIVRALWLAGALILSYTGTITVVPVLLLLVLFIFIRYRWAVWRGWLPGGIALAVVLPDIWFNKLSPTVSHISAISMIPGGSHQLRGMSAVDALVWYWQLFVGATVFHTVLSVVLVTLTVFAVLRRRNVGRFWLLWMFLVPLVLYALDTYLGILGRYSWWYGLGLVIAFGVGLNLLPRRMFPFMAALGVVLLLAPTGYSDFGKFALGGSVVGSNLADLKHYVQPGDVMLFDSQLGCQGWDYFRRVYLGDGVPSIDRLQNQQRVWYAHSVINHDEATYAAVTANRIAGPFVGPPECHIRLYEAPPDPEGVLFVNGLRFHGITVMTPDGIDSGTIVRHENEQVQLQLWWSVDEPIPLDYSVSVYMLEEGSSTILESSDGLEEVIYPPEAQARTSTWQPNQLYVETRTFRLPKRVGSATYPISLGVYFWENPTLIEVVNAETDVHGLLHLLTVYSVAW